MQEKVLIFLFSLCFVAYNSNGCEPPLYNQISSFDDSEYIFIGKVVGYTTPIKFDRELETTKGLKKIEKQNFLQTSGLIVKVKESVILPTVPKGNFEVFIYGMNPQCLQLGIQANELQRSFPVNSEVLVVANEPLNVPQKTENNNFRIEIRFWSNSFVALNSKNGVEHLASANSIFDYKLTLSDKPYRTDTYFSSKYFDIRKDLLRLKKAKNLAERKDILERIVFLNNSPTVLDSYKLFRNYSETREEAEQLYKKHLQINGVSEEMIREEIERQRNLELKRKAK